MTRFETITVKIGHLLLAVVLVSCNSCYVNKKTEKNGSEIKGINLIAKLDFVKSDDGKTFTVNDSLSIFYYKDLVLYRFGVPYDSMKTIHKSKDTITNQYLATRIDYKYFVYRNGNKAGLQYDSLNSVPRKFSVDSLLISNPFQNAKFYDKTNDSLFENFTYKRGNLIRKYIPKVKYDQSYNDTTCMYFSKSLNNINFSFSNELDSLTGMKLFKVEAIFEPIPKGFYSFDVPRRTYLFEMNRNKEIDLKKEKNIFELFQSQFNN